MQLRPCRYRFLLLRVRSVGRHFFFHHQGCDEGGVLGHSPWSQGCRPGKHAIPTRQRSDEGGRYGRVNGVANSQGQPIGPYASDLEYQLAPPKGAFYGSDGKGAIWGFTPASPLRSSHTSSPRTPLEMAMSRLSSAFDGRRSMRSKLVTTEEWEFATFIGSESINDKDLEDGKQPLWERRDTL